MVVSVEVDRMSISSATWHRMTETAELIRVMFWTVADVVC